MYGHFVHEAVIANKEKESGITIHYVDELYDHGQIIFQTSFLLNENETAESLAGRIHELEHRHFSRVVEEIVGGKVGIVKNTFKNYDILSMKTISQIDQ